MSPIRKRLLDRLLIGTVLVVAAPAMSQVREEVRTRYPAPGIEQISVDLGFSISGPQPRFVGDVDGDGYDDFVVRLYVSQLLELDPGPESPVLVTVVYGGPRSGESERPLEGRRQSRFRFDYERFRENTEDGFFPDEYIAAVGDVDGDGFSDFCISSWEAWVDGKQRGKVLLIFGSDSFPEEIDFEDFVASGGRFVEFLGDDLVGAGPRMSEAGDLNGDGHMDLAVVDRVPDGRGEFSFTYQVDVVFGPLGANPVVSLSETGRDVPGFVFHETVDGKSYQLTPAGDLNGDGLDDLIVGGKAADDAEEFAAVIYGVREFPPDLHADQPESFGVKFLAPHGQFEIELFDARGAGDVDGDALNDFFFASQEGGEAYLVYGSRDWPSEVNVDHPSVRTSRFVETDPPVLHPEIPRIPDVAQGIPRFSLGDATAIGDWDGDGYSDLFLGNWRRTVDFGDDVGRAFVVFGGPELPARSEDRDIGTGDLPGVALFGRQPSVQFGIKAEAGGDFDGDGIEDFIVNSGNTKGSLDFTGPTIFHVLYGRRERGFPLTAAAVRPSAIPLAGGSKATLFGTGFDEDATVTVAGVPATGVEVISAAELRFTVPPGAVEGGAAVEVRSGGEVSGLPSGLTYTPVRPIEDLFLHAETLQPEAYRSLVFEDFASLASVNPAIRQFVSVFTSDINLDGLDDLLIGSPVDEGILRQGRLAVLFGSKSLPRLVGPGESGDHGTTISADSATSGRFATSVVAGDLDGDGLAEIAIGGGIEVPAQSPSSGRTIIVRGRTSWSPSIDLEEELPAGRALAIRSDGCRFPTVAGPGDFNGDGVPDLLVTSNGCVGLNAEAKLFLSGFPRGESVPEPDSILRGDPTPLTHKAINGPATRRFGWISAAGGNLNGDGVEDFIVGADHVVGAFYVVLGSRDGFDGDASVLEYLESGRAMRLYYNWATAEFGRSGVVAGDFNGDGLVDVALGAPGGGIGNEGEVLLLLGSPEIAAVYTEVDATDPPPGLLVRIRGASAYDWAGWPGALGDVDGDGLDDLGIVGSYHRNIEPRAYVIFGDRDPPSFIDLGDLGSRGFTIRAPLGHIFSSLRGSITAGDYDGDGNRDIAIGFATGPGKTQRVHVVFGRSGEPARFIRGDANGDGRVNLTDAVLILEHLFGGNGAASRCRDSLDANDTGSIDLTDAVFVLNFLFGSGAAPPAPYPEPGPDPTADELSCLGG